MAIICNAKLLNMDLTVQQLSDKHQLNPNNRGIVPIDKAIFYAPSSQSACIGNIIHIYRYGYENFYEIEVNDGTTFLVAFTTELISENNSVIGMAIGGIEIGHKIAFWNNGKLTYKTVTRIRCPKGLANSYRIHMLHKESYILDNGLLVASD